MGDLDICLIKEFSRRPGFYDRGDSHFKDKTYIQQAWGEISHQLGYDANLLKDRMYQLRNRYNLEKRRLENLRIEEPSKQIRSPWPLFYHLTFLDGHIRPRRSYKSMMRRHLDTERSGNEEDPIAVPERRHSSLRNGSQHSNGNIDIKYETEIDSEEEPKAIDTDSQFLDPANFLADEVDSVGEQSQSHYANSNGRTTAQSHSRGNGIHVRSIESLKRNLSTTSDDFELQLPPQKLSRTIDITSPSSGRINKFEAFGRFLAASLSDLNENKALEMIEKITSDVVKALMENKSSSSNDN